jgi:hypothetical protein
MPRKSGLTPLVAEGNPAKTARETARFCFIDSFGQLAQRVSGDRLAGKIDPGDRF